MSRLGVCLPFEGEEFPFPPLPSPSPAKVLAISVGETLLIRVMIGIYEFVQILFLLAMGIMRGYRAVDVDSKG